MIMIKRMFEPFHYAKTSTSSYIAGSYEAKANFKPIEIRFIDDTENKVIGEHKFVNNYKNRMNFYDYLHKKIANFEKSNSQLTVSDLRDRLSHLAQGENHFDIHFVHDIEDVRRSKVINETVHYVFEEGGQQAYRDYKAEPYYFMQKGKKDRVTKKVVWEATDGHVFAPVISPWIMGYNASSPIIRAQKVQVNDSDFNLDQDININVYYRKEESSE